MKRLILQTGAGDSFSNVAKEAKERASRHELVEFEFNGVKCLVSKDTNLDWLYRDYSNSWLMDWKIVGPDCLENYEPEVKEEFNKRKVAADIKAEDQRKEYEAKEKREREAFDLLVKGINVEIIPGKEKEYADYVAKNSDDGYSRAVIDYGEGWAKVMQTEIVKGKIVKDIAEASQKGLGFLGITGFQYGCVVNGLAHFWKHGEELRKWHNKQYGVSEDKKGVVNPAVLTIAAQ